MISSLSSRAVVTSNKGKAKIDSRLCPIRGCTTKQPHTQNPVVQSLIQFFANPVQITTWTRIAISELMDSIRRDMRDKKIFAWNARLRQPEELYIRVVYALFIAEEKELHHILAGVRPNGSSQMRASVNELVFSGRGLPLSQPALHRGAFKVIETLDNGAHSSFAVFMTCISLGQHPDFFGRSFEQKYLNQLTKYCRDLEYMTEMFRAGKSKDETLAAVRNLNKLAS